MITPTIAPLPLVGDDMMQYVPTPPFTTELYQVLFEQATDGLFLADSQGRFLAVNRRGCQMLGYSREGMLGLTWWELLSAKVGDEEMRPGNGGDLQERPLRCQNGHFLPVEIQTHRLSDGRFLRTVRDLTERKQTKHTIQLKDELLHLTGEMAQVGGWEFDPITQTGTWTDEVAHIHDLPPDQPTTVALGVSFYVGESRPKIEQAIQKAIELGEPYDLELEMVSAKGVSKWVRTAGTPILEGGRVVKIRGIFQDITDRKQVELALQASESRYRAAIETSADGFWMLDENGRLLEVNDAYVRRSGYSRAELLTMDMDMLEAQATAAETAVQRQTLRQKGTMLFETQHRAKDGSLWPVEVNASYWPLPQGRFFAFLRDISKRRHLEETNRENLEKYHALFEAFPLGITITNHEGQIIEANKESEQILGVLRDEHEDRTIDGPEWQIVRPDGRPMPATEYASVRALHENRLIRNVEMGIVKGPGEITWINVTAVPIPLPQYGVAVTYHDISERKRAEMALQKSEAQFATIFRASPIGIYLTRLSDGQIVNINDAFVTIMGYTRKQLIGQTTTALNMYTDPTDRARLVALLKEQGHIPHMELKFRRQSGQIGYALVAAEVIECDGEKQMLSMLNDITERKRVDAEILQLNVQLEQRIAQRTAQLKEANQELEAFAYSVSHDLRAPLRAIAGYTTILLEDYAPTLDTEGQRVCGIIRAETQRMGQLIDDLLAFSRLTRTQMQVVAVAMEPIITAVYEKLTTPADRESIQFQVDPLPVTVGDAVLLRQVWMNLISNALKFSGKQKRPFIHISGHQENKEIIYCIRDNGAGFDMRYAHKLFGVFQRLHHERDFPGTGVGLAIVQRIIHRHNGRIWAQGEVGQGATFYFSLPATDPQIKGE